MNNQLTILATAYAVNPYKGSEDGMGWNFAVQIARYNKLVLVTRENNRAGIEKYMREKPNPVYENISFLYFDLPYWMRFWKKGGRGAMLYFWMWQKAIPGFVRRRHIRFDVAHNLNFHNDWTPSFLWKLKKPFVWGPVGHHPPIPIQYLKEFGMASVVRDRVKWFIKKMAWKFSSSLNSTISKAAHIISMNTDVKRHIGIHDKPITIIPSVATESTPRYGFVARLTFRLISVGRLVELKGFDLAIHAFASFLKELSPAQREACELTIVGKGPLKEYYADMIRTNGLELNVKLVDWMERADLVNIYQKSSAFLFPSHEGAGMVVAEALSNGLPVICLDNTGPGEFVDASCGITVAHQDYETTVHDLATAIAKLYNSPSTRHQLSKGAIARFKSQFDWNLRGEQLKRIYESVVA